MLKSILLAMTIYAVALGAQAQSTPGKGWLEGIVVDERENGREAYIQIRRNDRTNERSANSDGYRQGFYEFLDLKPGVYEVRATKSDYRPVRIFGVVVEPDKRTRLKIVMKEGKETEEIGSPNVVTEKAVLITDELARLRKEKTSRQKERLMM